MIRKALIIANPGKRGASNYCEGVNRDIDNYRDYLQSPCGGLWYDHEIKVLFQPSVAEVYAQILSSAGVDYLLTVFSGHAEYNKARDCTMLEIAPDVEVEHLSLAGGASRHTLILDCCRQVAEDQLLQTRMAKAISDSLKSQLSSSKCRRLFDFKVAACPRGEVVLYGCSVGESAEDLASRGGIYSYSLLDAAERWIEQNNSGSYITEKYLSIVDCHESARAKVIRESAGQQNPDIKKPRSIPYFPFSVIA